MVQLIVAYCGLMVAVIWVKNDSGNCLLPDGTEPIAVPMLVYHKKCSVAFTRKQFHRRHSWTWFITYFEDFEDYTLKITAMSSSSQWVDKIHHYKEHDNDLSRLHERSWNLGILIYWSATIWVLSTIFHWSVCVCWKAYPCQQQRNYQDLVLLDSVLEINGKW